MANIYDHIKEMAKIDVEYHDYELGEKKLILKSYIKRLDDDTMLIEPPTFQGKSHNIVIGQHIKILIKTKDGVYSGLSSIVGKELSHISGLLVSYPTDVKFVQRREYVRVPLVLPLEITITQDSQGTQQKVLNVETFDISGTGLCFITDEPLSDYYSIQCKFNLNDNIETPFNVACDYIYCNKIIYKGKTRYKNAFMFIDLDKISTNRLIKAVFLYQLELKKKGLL